MSIPRSQKLSVESGFDTYQDYAKGTAIYPSQYACAYPILGLAGEVGELANKYKKVLRDDKPLDLEDVQSELGDILWYLSAVASDFGLNLGDVANSNINKLLDRQRRNVLGGSGDNR